MSDINTNAGNAIAGLGNSLGLQVGLQFSNLQADANKQWEREMQRAARKAAMEIAVKLPEDHSRALAILAAAARFHGELVGDVPQDDADRG